MIDDVRCVIHYLFSHCSVHHSTRHSLNASSPHYGTPCLMGMRVSIQHVRGHSLNIPIFRGQGTVYSWIVMFSLIVTIEKELSDGDELGCKVPSVMMFIFCLDAT